MATATDRRVATVHVNPLDVARLLGAPSSVTVDEVWVEHDPEYIGFRLSGSGLSQSANLAQVPELRHHMQSAPDEPWRLHMFLDISSEVQS